MTVFCEGTGLAGVAECLMSRESELRESTAYRIGPYSLFIKKKIKYFTFLCKCNTCKDK